ncbi:fibrillarin-like rRNA/tRNA 2'-O-methyltransferase [Candidatus Woesearchaeota archaeon]|nr:fibrillarin-like rRNA/tRNA 2'-O-methyltransferase [Candidatus Woesearchaeota archaeon]
MQKTRFDGIYYIEKGKNKLLCTENLTPEKRFFEEDLIRDKGNEYRVWDPRRSKLAAGIKKGLSQIGLKPGFFVLYLGASHGYTPSFVSDIVGKEGFVFALDFAPRVVRDLVFLCEKRKNIAPILADANQPEKYMHQITEVDFIYQDIAQKNQSQIFLRNCELFLKKDAFAILCVKARSVDVTKKPSVIYQQVRRELEKVITIVDYKILDPFEKDHCIFVCKKK